MPGLLALLAHPDDEFFCAGLLAAVAAHGVPVHLAWWTRGEGGGSPQRRLVGRFLPRSWHVRVREARRAAGILGAESVSFMGAVDPVPVGNKAFAPEQVFEETVRGIELLRARYHPELLLTHGSDGEYGHPAHRRLHEAVWQFSDRLPLASFAAALPAGHSSLRYFNQSDPADYIIDSRPFVRKKMEIVRAHRSQAGVFEKLANRDRPSLRGLMWASRFEGYHVPEREPGRSQSLALLQQWAGESVAV